MLYTYTLGKVPDFVPTVFDNYSGIVDIDGATVNIGLWDYTMRGDSERLRPLAYPETDVFLLQFSVDNRQSFESISKKWNPEVIKYCPSAQKLLIGLKTDLRDESVNLEGQLVEGKGTADDQGRFVQREEGIALAKEIGARCYLECSALTQNGLKEVFAEAIRSVLVKPNQGRKKKGDGCILM